jgi:hypothetical protein
MATVCLTARYLDQLKPQRTRFEVFDILVPGLAIRVSFAATRSQSETPPSTTRRNRGRRAGLERALRRIGINVGAGSPVKKSMTSLTQSSVSCESH